MKSSDGGGTRFKDIVVDQKISFKMGTSFWHDTNFTVTIETTPPLPVGTEVKVHLEYTY